MTRDLIRLGPDPALESHWRALPLWQRWCIIHVVDGVTLKTWIEDGSSLRAERFHVLAKRRPGGDTWECEIHMSVLEEAHDTDFVIVHMLRGMREDFMLPEAECEATALRRLRAMAHEITPMSTPAIAEIAWLMPRTE